MELSCGDYSMFEDAAYEAVWRRARLKTLTCPLVAFAILLYIWLYPENGGDIEQRSIEEARLKEQSFGYRITDLQESERPRERLAKHGPQALSNSELLAILLRVGVAGENAIQVGQRLLQELGGLQGIHRASYEEVCKHRGVGPAKAAQIKAAIELGRRLTVEAPEERPAVHSPDDAASLVQYEMSALEQEELRVILLDTRNRVEQILTIYRGSLSSSQVRVGELFKAAIRRNSAALIMVHNHPSGDPSPSPEDIALTRAIVQAGKLLDVEVLDHLVIGQGRHVSLKERGLCFS